MTTTEQKSETRLTIQECWGLIAPTGRGILATAAGARADMFPVNYLVDGETLLFRSAPGSKLEQLTAAPDVAFEIDGATSEGYWSVVIRGRATRLSDDVEIIGSGALELFAIAPGEKRNFVRITPDAVEGRRVPHATLTNWWG